MKRAAVAMVALLSGLVMAQSQTPTRRAATALLGLSQASPGTTSPNSTGSTTTFGSRTVPGALRLTGCSEYQITLCAVTGTIAATGTLQIYYWPDTLLNVWTPTAWSRNKQIDETVPSTVATDCAGSTCPCITFPTRPTGGMGWVYAAPASVTTSGGGATVRVLVEAICSS